MKQARKPTILTQGGVLKDGRKSALVRDSKAALIFRKPYVVMKKIETIRAITSSSPIRIPASAIRKVSSRAFRGSLAAPVPLAKKRGVILSIAVDCNILGAASILPSAELNVAPHIPAITS